MNSHLNTNLMNACVKCDDFVTFLPVLGQNVAADDDAMLTTVSTLELFVT